MDSEGEVQHPLLALTIVITEIEFPGLKALNNPNNLFSTYCFYLKDHPVLIFALSLG